MNSKTVICTNTSEAQTFDIKVSRQYVDIMDNREKINQSRSNRPVGRTPRQGGEMTSAQMMRHVVGNSIW